MSDDEGDGKGDLYDVFGSDLEVSDEDGDEKRPSSSSKRKATKVLDEDEDDDLDDSDDDVEIAPRKRKLSGAGGKKGGKEAGGRRSGHKKKSKKLTSNSVEDDDDDDELRGRSKGSDDEARAALKELGADNDAEDTDGGDSEDLAEPEPEKEKEMTQTEKAFKSVGKNKLKKKSYEDMRQEAESLVTRMWKARDKDFVAFKRDQPALEKLKMLPQVEEYVRKVDYREMLLQHKLLGALRLWLDPMPDGSLPNQTVRTRILKLLDEFAVGEEWTVCLKESGGLGKVVNFLSQKDTFEPNRRDAKKLISKWTRPIFETQADYRGGQNDHEQPSRGSRSGGKSDGNPPPQTAYEKAIQNSDAAKFYARIPRPVSFNFKKIPESSLHPGEDEVPEKALQDSKKSFVMMRMKRMKEAGKGRSGHAVNLSVEGRGLM